MVEETNPISEIEKILLADPHILSIHPAEKREFPEIDYSIFDCKSKQDIEETVCLIRDVLESAYITDDFEKHSDRRNWRATLFEKCGEEVGKYYCSNSLRLNRFSPLFGSIIYGFEYKYIGDNKAELKRLGDEVRKFALSRKEYDLKSNDEKILCVKEIKKAVYNFLDFFAVK